MPMRVAGTKETCQITGLSRTMIHEKGSPDSPQFDESFPRPFKLSAVKNGWLVSELEEWIKSRIDASRSQRISKSTKSDHVASSNSQQELSSTFNNVQVAP